jgi:clan AA aspartic protease (TIGR02281 family)
MDFMEGCVKTSNEKIKSMQGMSFDSNKYCSCVFDELFVKMDEGELEKLQNDNSVSDFLQKEANKKIIASCFESNLELHEDLKLEQFSDSKTEKDNWTEACKKLITGGLDSFEEWDSESNDFFCECTFDRMTSKGYTYGDVLQIGDENSIAFNEIVVPCLTDVLERAKFKTSKNYVLTDIIGNVDKSVVSLMAYLSAGFKVKITIGGVSKYFLLDTGASDIIIDGGTEKELLRLGYLKKENYLSKNEYTLADNRVVEAQTARVDNIHIGDYTVNNVVIAILEQGSLLCGVSFLDKFRKWEIDSKNKVLILYK